MSDDPLSNALQSDEDPYRTPPVRSILLSLFEGAHPALLAEATGTFLERLTLLEMYVEEEMKLPIEQEDLEKFRANHIDELARETARMAQLFYGRIASREGH